MPKLPFAGFTAGAQGINPGSPRSHQVPTVGANVGRATARLGQAVGGLGETILRVATEREQRNVQVESAKSTVDFARELNEAVLSGGDFEAVSQRHLDRLDTLGEGISTPGGMHSYKVARARAEGGFADSVMRAHAKRAGLEAKTQTRDMSNILGASVMADPESLDAAKLEMADFIGSFGNLSPEDRGGMVAISDNELTVSAVEGVLRNDPARLQLALERGDFEDLRPAQRAAFLGQTDSELRRQAREAKTKDEMGKLLLRQALDTEAQDHVLTNEEAPEWFEQGVTAGQYDAAMASSIKAQAARDKLDRDADTITAGGGAALSQGDYENALTKLTVDATEGMEPDEASGAAVNMRTESAVHNGRADTKLASILNAGPAGSEQTFEAGLAIRSKLQEQKPELLAKMIDSRSRAWYNSYDFMVDKLGIDPETARGRLFQTSEDQKDTEARLGSKENRELLEDAIDLGFAGQNAMVRRDAEKRASYYMALVPTMTAEQAVNMAVKDFDESTVELPSGIRAPAAGVPVNWEPAEKYVRHVALERDLKAANVPYDVEELDDYTFFPNGDGTVAVIGTNGLTIFPRWDWQAATDEWWLEIGQQDVAIEHQETIKKAKKAEALGERRLAPTLPPMSGPTGAL